jgi:hypothetical protein
MPGMNLHSVILSYAEKAKLSVILGAIESRSVCWNKKKVQNNDAQQNDIKEKIKKWVDGNLKKKNTNGGDERGAGVTSSEAAEYNSAQFRALPVQSVAALGANQTPSHVGGIQLV